VTEARKAASVGVSIMLGAGRHMHNPASQILPFIGIVKWEILRSRRRD